MKKIFLKIFVTIFVLCAVLPSVLFLTACETASFENTPWVGKTTKKAQIEDSLNNVSTNLKHMLGSGREDLSIRSQFDTTTTFTLYKDPQNITPNYSKKIIKDTTSCSFTSSSNIEIDPIANITTARTISAGGASQKICAIEEIYAISDGCVYIKDEQTSLSNNQTKTQERTQEITPGGDYFLSLLKQKAILVCDDIKEISQLEQKSFDGVKYYKLSSATSSSREQVNKKFVQNTDEDTLPHLFEVYDLGYDFVDDFYYIYGIDDDANSCVSYFELNYTVSRAIADYDGARETYLSVSVVTKLTAKGEDVTSPQRPENTNAYVVGNFVCAMQTDENYVVYRKGNTTGVYEKTTIYSSIANGKQKKQIMVEYCDAELLIGTAYFVVYDGITYQITQNEDNTTQIESDYSDACLNFDFTNDKTSSSQDTFHYGASGSGFSINITESVLSISPIVVLGGDITYTILSYGLGTPQTPLYDIED